ncbi:DUF222 domain-containing protein [Arthrobacter sp. GCM10027362]|uniref:HNH endonuclease signature motif containing protein n=1 Tax=Arthrobacter sp. GCM10027362 TaxID=3273379 RepID=UPI0036347F62
MLEACLHKLLLEVRAKQLGFPDAASAAGQIRPADAAGGRPPQPAVELAKQLTGSDISTLDDSETIDFLKAATRLQNMVQSLIVEALHRFTVLRPAVAGEAGAVDGYSRFAAGEVSAALALGEAAARKDLNDAVQIRAHLPATAAAMAAGDLDLPRAAAIARGSADLPLEVLPEFEEAVVPGAGTITRQGVEARTRAARHRLHPESLEERCRRALESRDVSLVPQQDGMAELWIRTSAEKAFLIYHRVQTLARSLQGPDESRLLPQLRADVIADLLTGAAQDPPWLARGTAAHCAGGAGPVTVAGVAVTLSLETAAGLGREPGDLAGYGPIPAGQARELAALAKSWLPVLTDGDGRAIAAAARLRIPPGWLKRQVRLRDRHCRFPGCRRAAVHCEIDHVIAWEDGGETVPENLQCLCEAHHAAKQHGGWTARPGPGGRIDWTARTGHRYATDPEDGWDIAVRSAQPAGGGPGSGVPGPDPDIGGPPTGAGPDAPPF